MLVRFTLLPVLCATAAVAATAAGLPHVKPETVGMDPQALAGLDTLIRQSIHAGNTAGAVCVVGHKGRVVYRKAFGYAALRPAKRLMTPDTVFDLASLTKVTATAPSVMKLVEQGRLSLESDMATVWPAYAARDKGDITIRQLLTHTAGLSPGHGFFARYAERNRGRAPGGPGWQDVYPQAMAELADAALRSRPDARFVYSDDGFMTLGEVVRRVSGETLDVFARKHIFGPLGMKDTGFRPAPSVAKRAAVTQERYGRWLQGEVHDPNSWALGGVTGHAGLFSTADDMARYCQMYLNGGTLDGTRVLSPATVRAMTNPASPLGLPERGLGWDVNSGYTKRGDLFSRESFGHTGWTGTSVWVDQPSQTFVVLLSNRVHVPNGNVLGLQWRVATVVAGAVTDAPAAHRTAAMAPPRPERAEDAPVPAPLTMANTVTGLEALAEEKYERLRGRKIGLITNPTGIDRRRRSTADLFWEQSQAGVFQLVAFFGPEHGIRADVDDIVEDATDPKTGLRVFSLYDYRRRIFKPTPEMLQGIDTLVFDIQDVGVRYYTYITTLAYAMQAARENNIRIVVLDRPNPVNGVIVDGPMLNLEKTSFAAFAPTPQRHGMTVGELARYYNDVLKIGADLDVVPMRNWYRRLWFDQTGLPWVNPSPNIRNLTQATLYAAIGPIEAAALSVGRGTDRPFELFGAPWIDDVQLAEELNRRQMPGVTFVPQQFTPNTREFKGELCKGVNIQVLDRDAIRGTRMAVEILDALRRLYPSVDVGIKGTRGLFGSQNVTDRIMAGQPIDTIAASWRKDVDDFQRARRKYLLYP